MKGQLKSEISKTLSISNLWQIRMVTVNWFS